MAGFKDAKGRSWELKLDAPLVKRIKSLCGITLTDLKSDPFLELAIDPVKLVDVLFVCCESQAKAAGITDVDFGEGIGESIADAVAALEVAVIDFFPPTMRSSLQSLLAKGRQMQAKTMATAIQEMDANDAEIEQAISRMCKTRILEALEQTTGDSRD